MVTTAALLGAWEYALGALAFIVLFIIVFGTAIFIAEKRDEEKPPPWAECLFQLPGRKLVEVCLLAAVFGMAFGVAFGGLAALGFAYGNPTATIAPPWGPVVEVAGVIGLILAAGVYWRLVYRHLKQAVQHQLTRVTPVEGIPFDEQ